MPIESTPKEVDPADVALAPEDQLCEEIFQRVLSEVRAHIDRRIAVIEARAASEPVESGEPAVHGSAHAGAHLVIRRKPWLLVAVGVLASAGLVGAVVTLAGGASATNWMQEAVQSVRQNLERVASTGGPEAATGPNPAEVTSAEGALVASASGSSSSPPPASPASAPGDAAAMRDLAPSIEKIAHDLAPSIEKVAHVAGELQVALQDLKTRQEQATRDHARAIEQLQASQDQLTRALRAAAERLAPPPPAPRPPRFR